MENLSVQFIGFLNAIKVGLPLLVIATLMVRVAKTVRYKMNSNIDDNKVLFKDDNPAYGKATFGFFLGLIIAVSGVLEGSSKGLLVDMRDVVIYGSFIVVLFGLSRIIFDKVFFNKFSIDKELVNDKNKGMGWAMLGAYVATGYILRGAIMGDVNAVYPSVAAEIWAGIASTGFYFILSQIAFVIAGKFYQLLTPYDFHKELEEDNVAAGIALGGFLIGLGFVLGNAGGNTVGVNEAVMFYARVVVGLMVMTIARKVIAEHILTPGENIGKEIVEDKNENAGFACATAYILAAVFTALAI